ncbi:MAG: transposase, partial [Candidatus Hydrogenedentes bacterium]|nr:transposase [Candidatus Hydrogenedentota bacterium]
VEELYRQRWKVELWLRDLKITQGADILRCKSPEMIHKELTMHVIAYNLVRASILQAALEHEHRPEELAYKPCLDTLRQWAKYSTQPQTTKQKFQLLWKVLLETLARNRLPQRPDRNEPRAKKRRPKNYAMLNKPRKEFKETPHRNQYKAPLS